ncbi:MAG TPA: GlmU family protein [Candidatus Acidoferrales bacterium]|nr:GlmU family protein [Candidatus Acidoferrales bacterium]
MHLCIFEDNYYKKLLPLVHFRPAYDLRCGITTLKEKILRSYPNVTLTLHSREYLASVVKEKSADVSVNKFPSETKEALLINGRLLMSADEAKIFGDKYPGKDIVFYKDNVVIAAWLSNENLNRIRSSLKEGVLTSDLFASINKREFQQAPLITFPWELFQYNGSRLASDFTVLTNGTPKILGKVYEGVHLLNPSQIHIAEGAKVKPGAVLDAEEGPIYISKNAKIMPNAVIEGPAFIGENSVIKVGAKIYENTTIGETCKVGGEVEESIIHAYSNKQHEGFLGHAYLGEWVNIGADSNNSDLKNDYGSVKVYNDGSLIDSGSQFVGLTMGDHSKCGINSMFNTGTVVSVCCNIYGAGIPPKYVPAFSWGGTSDGFVTYKIDKAIDVARKVMTRRKTNMSDASEQLLRKVFEMTKEERAATGVKD